MSRSKKLKQPDQFPDPLPAASTGAHPHQESMNVKTDKTVYNSADQKKSEGPKIKFNTKDGQVEGITLTGTIYLFNSGTSTDRAQELHNRSIAVEHFTSGINHWNAAYNAFEETDRDYYENVENSRKAGHVVFNGRLIPVNLQIAVKGIDLATAQQKLQNPQADEVFILVSDDDAQDYNDDFATISGRQTPITPVSLPYRNQVVTTHNTLVNNPANGLVTPGSTLGPITMANVSQPLGMRTSFIVGNVGFYDLPTSQNRGNSSAAHEIGHWLSYKFLRGRFPFDPHRTDGYTEGPKRSIMADQANATHKWEDRYPLNRDILDYTLPFPNTAAYNNAAETNQPLVIAPNLINAGIGRATDFNIYQQSGTGQQDFLGDRMPNGQLLLFNNLDLFTNAEEAGIFAREFASFPDYNPASGVAPQ